MKRKQRRILLLRPDRIGDVAIATPTIRALRQHFPDAYIAALLRPVTEPVLRHNPHLDDILIDDFENEHAGRSGFWNRVNMLRTHRFNTALLLLPTKRHTWMTFLAGIPLRIGVSRKLYQMLTFTKYVSRNKYIPLRHEADYCMDLARRLGVQNNDLNLEIIVTQEEKTSAAEQLSAIGRNNAHKLLILHPESGGSAPNWSPKAYAALCEEMLRRCDSVQLLVLLSRQGESLLSLFKAIANPRILLPQRNTDLRHAMAMIALADVTVSASTGPMHLAAGLGIPTVNLFCHLTACSPKLWGPKGNRAELLLPPETYCSTQCNNNPKQCTLDAGISVETVASAVLRQIGFQ